MNCACGTPLSPRIITGKCSLCRHGHSGYNGIPGATIDQPFLGKKRPPTVHELKRADKYGIIRVLNRKG